ncbi:MULTISPECIES: hypothetical protein [unclassified Microcystis]|uniref:hypothetical protein n=1 Tax=unclassified Microcystis TaxID=2643300 RepID=UPI00257D8AC9|nr:MULTISPECIES: hypothetical protein [unclassified Microcystis]
MLTEKDFYDYFAEETISIGFVSTQKPEEPDNLPAAIKACHLGGWTVLQSQQSFDYILDRSGFDLLKAFDKFSETQEFYIAR